MYTCSTLVTPLPFPPHPCLARVVGFEFMKSEGLKLENIGSLDIWDGTKPLILGMLWSIIYNFQILKGIGDSKGVGAKTELLMWLQSKIPEFGITNLVDDWRDGLALSALVNALGKEFKLGVLVAGAELMKPANAVSNLDKAMNAAEERICVGQILTATQMQDPALGEKSMMTYLSLYTKAHEPEKDATPLEKKALFSPPKAAAPEKPNADDDVDPILLQKINFLFAAMDADGNGGVSKFELIDFVQQNKPKTKTVAEVTSILKLDRQHEISKADFVQCFLAGRLDVDGFPLIKEHLPVEVPTTNASGLKSVLKSIPKKAEAKATSNQPPMEREADWRVYEGHDLGGRCRIRVYFSTTTSSAKIRGNTESMKTLLERKKYHLRPDFEHFVPVDMDMAKDLRDKIFEKAGTRITPMLFVDDEFVGGYDKCAEMEEEGSLDAIFAY